MEMLDKIQEKNQIETYFTLINIGLVILERRSTNGNERSGIRLRQCDRDVNQIQDARFYSVRSLISIKKQCRFVLFPP